MVIETPTAVYEYASDRLDWWHARLYCQQRFAQLPSESWEDELSSLGQNLSRQLQSTVWLEDEELLQRKPKPRRAHSPSTLIFGNKTDTKFVKVLADFPAMAAVSACAHVQWDPTATEVSTVFSYAVPAFTNEFQLRGIVDKDQFVKLAVILHGHHSPYLPVFRTDPHWHHVCVTWKQPNGTWVLYADGKQKASASGLAASRAIDGHGMFIIGQDQDSLGGAFKEKESFSGNLTDLQVWGRFLSQEQVEKVRSCVSIREGLIFDWRHDILEVETSVQEARVQLTCPGPVEECRVFQVAHGSQHSPCSAMLPFVCRYRKGRLKVVGRILSEAQPPPLDASSLLGVFQLLKEASEVEVEEPGQLEALEELGQHYVEVTGRLLEEKTTDDWSEIKPIIGGPMMVVENVDKMASSLHQLLSPDRAKITFHSKNIGIEVRRAELGPERAGGGAPLTPTHHWDQLDAIEIPADEVERLRVKGLRQITLTHTWYSYGALQHLLASSSAVFKDAAVSDGGRRHLSTQVASSIISSSLVSNYEEISTSVRYRLRHRVQASPDQLVEAVCAFWNFSRSPEGVGGWSTRGCSVSSSQEDLTTCACNHTTNFAVLLQVYEVQRSLEEESTLKTLTFVGCGVSFCALIVTLVLFLAVGHLTKGLPISPQGVCFAVTAFLHLFFMAAFAWMLVEGLLLWSKVVAVNMSEDRRMRFYYVTGWGLPVLIVGVTLATSFNKYVADNHCWLNVQTEVIWAFVGPVLFVLTREGWRNCLQTNRVQFWGLARKRPTFHPPTPLFCSVSRATTKPILVLLPVLGLTWVCGILVHLSVTWAYIFIMLNSLQGLYIFLVYALYNSELSGELPGAGRSLPLHTVMEAHLLFQRLRRALLLHPRLPPGFLFSCFRTAPTLSIICRAPGTPPGRWPDSTQPPQKIQPVPARRTRRRPRTKVGESSWAFQPAGRHTLHSDVGCCTRLMRLSSSTSTLGLLGRIKQGLMAMCGVYALASVKLWSMLHGSTTPLSLGHLWTPKHLEDTICLSLRSTTLPTPPALLSCPLPPFNQRRELAKQPCLAVFLSEGLDWL
ncbi:hypothetical protein E2320_006472 [Naja naja]|nr:hypothetical protein E2320_006472 [Naja naja]